MIEIIPAVDIIEGRCVRLTQGRYDEKTVFSDNPVEVALKWQDEGAKRLHIVDLDGARIGEPQNLDVVRRICHAVSIPTQMGGGESGHGSPLISSRLAWIIFKPTASAATGSVLAMIPP